MISPNQNIVPGPVRPQVISWFTTPPSIVISPINPYEQFRQVSYLGGLTLYL